MKKVCDLNWKLELQKLLLEGNDKPAHTPTIEVSTINTTMNYQTVQHFNQNNRIQQETNMEDETYDRSVLLKMLLFGY